MLSIGISVGPAKGRHDTDEGKHSIDISTPRELDLPRYIVADLIVARGECVKDLELDGQAAKECGRLQPILCSTRRNSTML